MNDKDKEWLEKCIREPKRYKVCVDNDLVNVLDETIEESVHSFEKYAEYFALQLLQHMGCNADMV